MRPFPADADARSQKSDQSAPKDAGKVAVRAEPHADAKASAATPVSAGTGAAGTPSGGVSKAPASASPPPQGTKIIADSRTEPQRGRLESRYQAHKRVALGAISSKPTAASGLPADTEPSNANPEAIEEAMRQAWAKVFGKKS